MAIIKTERNCVYALDPQEGDCLVETRIGPGEGSSGVYYLLYVRPIEDYQAAVDWAVSRADQFEHPIHIVPLNVMEVTQQ